MHASVYDDDPFVAIDLEGVIACPSHSVISSVFVTRSRYDADLHHAYANAEGVRMQARLDFPRSLVEIDGRRRTTPPMRTPIADLMWCTQSVMGLPVERLHRAGLVAMEPTAQRWERKLRVRLNTVDREVLATKVLVVLPLTADLASQTAVPIFVLVHAQRDHVRIDFVHLRGDSRALVGKTLSVPDPTSGER
jgi:hypothetical protein